MKKTFAALACTLSLVLSAAAPAAGSDDMVTDGFLDEYEIVEVEEADSAFPEDLTVQEDLSDLTDMDLAVDAADAETSPDTASDDLLSEELTDDSLLLDGFLDGDGLAGGTVTEDTLEEGIFTEDALTDGTSINDSQVLLDIPEGSDSMPESASGTDLQSRDKEENSLLEIDPSEEQQTAEMEIVEEEVFEEGYDPTVTPDGNAGAIQKRRLMRAASNEATFISNYTSFRDQLDEFSQFIYDKMVDVYITQGIMGSTTAKDTSGTTVPAEKITFTDAETAAFGLTFDAQTYVGTDGKLHIDTTTEAYKAKYAHLTYHIQSAIDAFTYDHPEVYWYRPNGYKSGFSATPVTADGQTTYLGYFSSCTLLMKETFTGAYDLRSTFSTQVDAVSSQLAASSDFDGDGAVSTLEYIQAAHDYIIRRAYYDHTSLASYTSTGDYRIFCAAGMFVDSVGSGIVCEGYSKAMKVLLNAQGIACCLIPGTVTSSNEGHMWNGINFDGSWYLTDVTWDDKKGEPVTSEYFTYYLVPQISGRTTSSRISDSTKADAQNFAYPAVAAVADHTFVKTACTPYSRYSCSDGDGVAYFLPATAHVLSRLDAVEPTCKTEGRIECYTCTVCGKYFADSEGSEPLSEEQVKRPTGSHTLNRIEAKAPTCETAGNIEYYKCGVCEKIFSDEAGQTEITIEDTILPASHKLVLTEEIAPTCETVGNIAYYTCRNCGKLYRDAAGTEELTQDQVATPATGHNRVKTAAKAATCETTGNIEYYTCSTCKKFFSDPEGTKEITQVETVTPAKGHALTKTDAVVPTCETAGNIEYYTCSECGKIFSDPEGTKEITQAQTAAPATGHTLEKTEAVAATCEAAGNIEYYTCSKCEKIFSDPEGTKEITQEQTAVPATGHKLVKTTAKAATCETAGNIAYYTCSTCKKIFSDSKGTKELTKAQTVTAATGHSWDKGKITKYPTVSATGVRTYTCTHDASHTKKVTIPKLTEKEAEGSASKKSTVAWAEKKIIASGGELAGSSAADLRLYSTKQTNSSITLKWNKVKGAEGYILYGAVHTKGSKISRIQKITGGSKTSCTVKKLKKATFYKYSLAAYKTVNGIENVIASSKMIYVVTKGGKLTNISKVKASKKSVSVKKGKTTKVKATTTKQAKTKKLKTYRALRYVSSNTKIAAVNAKTGKITAKKAGSCYIYVYAQTGVFARIKVKVR